VIQHPRPPVTFIADKLQCDRQRCLSSIRRDMHHIAEQRRRVRKTPEVG
jgi:hypothetical protein